MKHGSATAIVTALLFAAAAAAPALAQSGGVPTSGAAQRDNSSGITTQPPSRSDRPPAAGSMSNTPSARSQESVTPRSEPGAAGGMRSGAQDSATQRSDTMSGTAAEGRALGKAKSGAVSSDKVRAVQNALNRQGANLEVDGKMGPKTKAAIREYQQRNGLQATGNLDAQTMQRLGVS